MKKPTPAEQAELDRLLGEHAGEGVSHDPDDYAFWLPESQSKSPVLRAISEFDYSCDKAQRPTMKFVATKTAEQLDLQALHRVRERLVSQRTGVINQIRAFLLERGVAVRQGFRFLRAELPRILAAPPEVLSPRMVRIIEGLAEDWRRLDERIDCLSGEITALARRDAGCERLVSVPGIGPIISSAMVAAIGTGEAFFALPGRDPRQCSPCCGTAPPPGTVLVREWERTSHRVMVMPDGFAWNGKTFDSLSQVALAITGTKWSGPRFFGLRDKRPQVNAGGPE